MQITPELAKAFPQLDDFAETSPTDWLYNCHAWGADQTDCWWEPGRARTVSMQPYHTVPWMTIRRIYHWPQSPSTKGTLAEFRKAHATVGYEVCSNGSLEPGFEKIAHYITAAGVTHTARQLPWGTWTSKLGRGNDIEHRDLRQLEGGDYGRVGGYMKRPIQSVNVKPYSSLVLTKGAARRHVKRGAIKPLVRRAALDRQQDRGRTARTLSTVVAHLD